MDPPRLFIVLLKKCLVRLSPDLMFSHNNHFVTYLFNRARHLCQVWDPLMVIAISLVHRQGDDLSLSNLSDFIPHSTRWLCVRNKLTLKERDLSLGARALLSWRRVVPSTFISIFRLYSLTSYRLISEYWGLFQIYVQSVSFTEKSGL